MVEFGDLDDGIWGAAWGAQDPVVAFGSIRPGEPTPTCPVAIEGIAPTEDWGLTADGLELTLSPESEPSTAPERDEFDQLCRVRGRAVLDGAERELDLLGHRAIRAPADIRELACIRDLSAWFGPQQGIALTARRPRGVAGHDQDVVSATLFESSSGIPVVEPRLSTTYSAAGVPIRLSLELWLEEDDEGGQYPRRAAAENLGVSALSARGGIEVEAYAFRWHSGGHDGVGTYLLTRAA
jgi:hypothetical protein